MTRIVITGARGFLGREMVSAACAAGCEVAALSRRPEVDRIDDGVVWHSIDLGAENAGEALGPILENTSVVLHAAASFSGNAEAHAHDTIRATENLITAMQACATPPKLVLVSSFSVYDIPALADFSLLSEDSPVIRPDAQRDAYAKAKRCQELLALESGLEVVIIRPGAIYGPHRLWSAQLGFAKAGFVICPGGDALVPAVDVGAAARSLVQGALREIPDGTIINLIDPDPPTQGGWLAALGMRTLFAPRSWVLGIAPRLKRGPHWTARFKPLAYDGRRAQNLLGHAPNASFPNALRAAKRAEKGT